MNHAKELGIDLDVLLTERPEHVRQIQQRIQHERKAAAFWSAAAAPAVELLTLRQAAKVAHVHRETMRRWVAANRVPALRRDRRVWVDKDVLEAYLATRRVIQSAALINKVG